MECFLSTSFCKNKSIESSIKTCGELSNKNVEYFKKILKSNGLVYVATDVEEYARHVLEIFNSDVDFSWEANSADDWRQPWKDWVSTRYYEKAKQAGRKITFLIFKRR